MSAQNTTPDTDASTIDPDTRTRVASTNGGHCWLCGLLGKNVTRVLNTADLPLLYDLQRRGIAQGLDLNAFENLVFLCTACHVAFNDPALVWIFVPVSLDNFIASEEAFQTSRQCVATGGRRLPRLPAVAPAPDMLYSRYQLRSGHLFTQIFTSTPTQMWPGSPFAPIIRSVRVTAGFERLPVEDGGLPIDIALKLQRLLLLYGTPEPRQTTQVQRASAPAIGFSTQEPEPQIRQQVHSEVAKPIRGNQPRPDPPEDSAEDIPTPSPDPDHDLASVGRAFNSALKYVHDHSVHRDMTAEAHAWLAAEIHAIMVRLKRELHGLNANKDNPVRLPKYAINREKPWTFFSSYVPDVLLPYSAQFQDCFRKLFGACKLNAKCSLCTFGTPCFAYDITFAPNAEQSDAQAGGNRILDPEFENEFVSAVKVLTIEPK